MSTLTIRQGDSIRTIVFQGAPLLGTLLAFHALGVPQPCGGRGLCGKCAVKASGMLSPLTEAEKRAGTRLSCQTVLLGDAEVTLPDAAMQQIETGGTVPSAAPRPMPGDCGAAIDIGTTTLALKLFDLRDGRCIGQTARLNPQTQIAADVMGRIGAALNGQGMLLQRLVLDALHEMVTAACQQTGIAPEAVASFVLAGNTTMLYLLTGRAPSCLAHAPFHADELFGHTMEQGGHRAYLPPCMDAFVGADITCALLASGLMDKPETALLMDVGTNGEIALWHRGQLYAASTAAGPAFEGAGISCGCGAVAGAIDRVQAVNGRLHIHTIGNAPAVGLCGSGLLDAVAALLEIGQLDEIGALEDDIALAPGVTLTQADIRQVQLAKGAIAAGVETLLRSADVLEDQVAALYVAGGFGSQLNIRSAEAIGLIPRCWSNRAHILGNAALTGAGLLLTDASWQAAAQRAARDARTVSLGGNPVFADCFMEHMLFQEPQ